ncbi:MAG: hypothetical protein ACTSQZ_07990, partial [Candidatus Thorarchaeota archaeon]
MISKTEQIYVQMLDKEVVTLEDVERIASKVLRRKVPRTYLEREFIIRLRSEDKVRSIRRGLYHVVSPSSNNDTLDLFLVAGKI